MKNSQRRASDLVSRLEQQLQPRALAALDTCRHICAQRSLALYLVGGTVRDLALDIAGFDIDLALEVEVAPVAEALAAATGGRAVMHKRFGTAKVTGPGFVFDLARTRRETYAHAGALPAVEPASLGEDLARRDFTINAVALRLAPGEPELIDPYRGMADIASSLVRVLHERSFQDDATRMLRAVRYASRLGFKIAMHTEKLIGRDLSYLGTVSGPRLRRDLALQFEDLGAVDGVLLAQRLGILQAIHPALRLPDGVAALWREALAGPRLGPLDELGFCLVANPRDEATAASVSKWLHLTGRIEATLGALVRLRSVSDELAGAIDQPERAVELLERFPAAAVWALALLESGAPAATCLAYLQRWRHVRPQLNGDDLLALGVPQGVAVGETLRALKTARLRGRLETREEEVALVLRGLERRS